jgi:hypothetical protein
VFQLLDLKDDVATHWASGSCVSVPVGGIGKNSGIWEVGGVWGFSRMGWGFRAVAVVAALVEALVHFLCKKGRKKGIFSFFCVGFFLSDGTGRIVWFRIIAKDMKGRSG